MAKLTLVMKTLALMLLAPKLASRPPSAAATAKMTDSAATTSGLADKRWAAAAGVMARLSTSRVPTTWAAPVTVRASTTRNISPRRRTGTPRASAASGSMEANSSGRYQMAMTATTTTPIATRMSSWAPETPKMLPNKMLVAAVAKP